MKPPSETIISCMVVSVLLHATPVRRFIATMVGCGLALALSMPARAQQIGLPGARLNAIFPAGAQIGGECDIKITGIDLDDATALLFSHPGITATPKVAEPGLGQSGPQPIEGAFSVKVAANVRPGYYEARASGKYGVSNPRAFLVSAQPESLEVEPNNLPAQATAIQLNSIVNGRSDGQADRDYFRFSAHAGERVVIDIWSYRLDSPMDPTLILSDANGRELKHNRDSNRRDALLDFVAPADGDYLVEVRDAIFAGGTDYVYRLAVSTGPYVDFVLPAAVAAGTTGEVTVFGRNLPGGQPAPQFVVDGSSLEMLRAKVASPTTEALGDGSWESLVEPDESSADLFDYQFDANGRFSNPVRLSVASAAVIEEQEPANNDPATAPLVAGPCVYCGQFYPRGDQDWLQLDAKAGETWSIEVVSQRLGRLTDPTLVIQQVITDAQGQTQIKDLMAVDDGVPNLGGRFFETASDDPIATFTAPADGRYRVGIRDLYNGARSDPRNVYNLVIRRPQPDFRVIATPHFAPANPDPNQNQPTVWSPVLRNGGTEMIDLYVFRRDGFAGEVTIVAEDLPPGVTTTPVVVGGDQRTATLVLKAENAMAGHSLARLLGKARIGEVEAVRTARCATMITPGVQNQVFSRSRLARSIAVSVFPEQVDFSLDVDGAAPLVLEMSRAGVVQAPLRVTRRGEFKGNVNVLAQGLPGNVQPKNLTIEASATEGKFEIALQNNAPLGQYSFHFFGKGQVQYKRNPEAAQAASQRKELVDKLAAEASATAKAMSEAKAAAEQTLSAMNAAAAQASEQKKAASANVTVAESARQAAVEQLKIADEALAKDPTNESLKQAKQNAENGVAEADIKLKAASESVAAAEKVEADAVEKVKAATDAKAAADKNAADAEARAKSVTETQQAVTKSAEEAAKRAQPQPRNIGMATSPVVLKITAGPIAPATSQSLGTVRQGTKIEAPIKLQRLYNFADAVPVRVQLPGGVSGLNIQQISIPQGQDQANLVIEAADSASPGEHRLSLQFVPRFNGQDLTVNQDVTLTVEKKP